MRHTCCTPCAVGRVGLPSGTQCEFHNPRPKGKPMKLLNPTITVRNTDTINWLVTVEHNFSDEESLVFTTKLPQQSRESLPEVQRMAMRKLVERLNILLGTGK